VSPLRLSPTLFASSLPIKNPAWRPKHKNWFLNVRGSRPTHQKPEVYREENGSEQWASHKTKQKDSLKREQGFGHEASWRHEIPQNLSAKCLASSLWARRDLARKNAGKTYVNGSGEGAPDRKQRRHSLRRERRLGDTVALAHEVPQNLSAKCLGSPRSPRRRDSSSDHYERSSRGKRNRHAPLHKNDSIASGRCLGQLYRSGQTASAVCHSVLL